ncbi:MAG: hypothetical protein MI923_02890 [Phycisphaerales bacterium]|nr:hypothetical protein [Phycisphaerales bacterium]
MGRNGAVRIVSWIDPLICDQRSSNDDAGASPWRTLAMDGTRLTDDLIGNV